MNRRTAVDDMRPLARGLRRASGARTPGPTVGISLSEAVLIRKVYCYIHCLHMDFWTLEVNCQGNKRQGKRVRTLRDFRTKSIRQCDLRGFKSEDPAGQVAPRRGARLDNPFIDRRYGDHAAYIFLVSTFLSNCRWHLLLVLIAVAHQGHVLRPAKPLRQTQRKLLAMVFNDAIALVDLSDLPKLLSITATELTPANETFLGAFQQSFARRKVWHPNVIPIEREARNFS